MNRRVWLSRSDVCALLQAKDLIEILKVSFPSEDAREHSARIMLMQKFRALVQKACFGLIDSMDHVLLDIPDDMYVILRAMGLCGLKDSRGRRICLGSALIKTMKKRLNLTPHDELLSIYSVLLRQSGLLFGLGRDFIDWTNKKQVIAWATTLFNKWQNDVKNAVATMALVVTQANDKKYKSDVLAKTFVNAACDLKKSLYNAVEWRLLKQDLPRVLIQFRQSATCPSSSGDLRLPNNQCKRLVGDYTRLFAARLTESAVMEALSLLDDNVVKNFVVALEIPISASDRSCDIKKMRLVWSEDSSHNLQYFGTLIKYFGTSSPPPRLKFGLSSSTTWNKEHDQLPIQDGLTNETWKLSLDSLLQTPNLTLNKRVLSQEVLDIDAQDSNLDFDFAYNNALKRPSPKQLQDPCNNVRSHDDMTRALVQFWSERKEIPKYPNCLTSLGPNQPITDKTTTVNNFQKKLIEIIEKLNTFAREYQYDPSNLHRYIYLVMTDIGKPPWSLPLTLERNKSLGLYDFVVWMICNEKVLTADKVTLNGEFRLDNKMVHGSFYSIILT